MNGRNRAGRAFPPPVQRHTIADKACKIHGQTLGSGMLQMGRKRAFRVDCEIGDWVEAIAVKEWDLDPEFRSFELPEVIANETGEPRWIFRRRGVRQDRHDKLTWVWVRME